MGYTSNVRMVIRGPEEVVLREFANLRVTGDKYMQDALDEWHVMECSGFEPMSDNPIPAAVAILGKGGTDWKWYENYSDVQAHTAIYNHFEGLYNEAEGDCMESFLDGAFVRVGENTDDIENENFGENGYELAQPVRTIDCFYDDIDKPDLRPRLAPAAA